MKETIKNNTQILLLNNWIVQVRRSSSPTSNRVMLMLHGYTGDEHSMTVFSRNLPTDLWIFSPRAPYASNEGGYKWIPSESGSTASFHDFQKAVQELEKALQSWKKLYQIQDEKVDVAGFSQGAVMALTYALTHPEGVRRVACLSGFLPDDTSQIIQGEPLKDLPVFIAHGTEDKTVSYKRAIETGQWLEQFGAKLAFCDAPVGHRISAPCFRAFTQFFGGQ